MTDLEQIIEEAFKSGWIAAKEYLKLKEEGSDLMEEIAYIHTLEIVLDDVHDFPPILTKEIFDEIYKQLWADDGGWREEMYPELLKKYNLEDNHDA